MNYREVAIKPGQVVNNDVSVQKIEQAFWAHSAIEFPTAISTLKITSERADEVFRWAMTIADAKFDDDKKREILRKVVVDLVPEESVGSLLLEFGLQSQPTRQGGSVYVNASRINDLRAIRSLNFDLPRLIAMCDELNLAYRQSAFLSCMMLLRAIIDHVPPIFGALTFQEIYNNGPSAKSFKDSMRHLGESSRKISDAYLHV